MDQTQAGHIEISLSRWALQQKRGGWKSQSNMALSTVFLKLYPTKLYLWLLAQSLALAFDIIKTFT